MKKEQIDEISEARKLFQKFESESKHKDRLRYFEDAIDLLDQYISDEPDSNLVQLAKNIKQTYTKNLLELLPSLNMLDIEDWFQYILLLLIKLTDEVELLTKKNVILKEYYNKFIRIWSAEVINKLQNK